MVFRRVWQWVLVGAVCAVNAQPLFYEVEGADTFVIYAPVHGYGPLFYERTFCIRLDDFFSLNPEMLREWDTTAWRRANPFTRGMAVDSALHTYSQWARRWTIRYFRAMPQQVRIRLPSDTLARCPAVPDSLRPTYTVRPGETWYALARRWSVSLDTLRRWNSAYGDVLPVGARLWRIGPSPPKDTTLSGNTQTPAPDSASTVVVWTNVPFSDTLWVRAGWISPPDRSANDPDVIFCNGIRRNQWVYVKSLNTGRMARLRVVAPPPADAGAEALIPGKTAAWLGEQRPRFRLMILIPAAAHH